MLMDGDVKGNRCNLLLKGLDKADDVFSCWLAYEADI
jgi:hypothetical protein